MVADRWKAGRQAGILLSWYPVLGIVQSALHFKNCHKCSLTNLLREATILIVSTPAYCSVENT